MDIREQDAHRQIEISYEFVDNPQLAFIVLEFNKLVMIRSSFILRHGTAVNANSVEDFFMGLLEQAERNGWTYRFVNR